MKKSLFLFAASVAVASLIGCSKEVEKLVEVPVYVDKNYDPALGVLKLTFENTVNGSALEINKNYQDASGNTYQFNEVRYWVSNIQLTKSSGEVVKLKDTYYLVENRDTLFYYGTTASSATLMKANPNKRESFTVGNIPLGDYTKVKFAVGVDPTYNNNFSLSAGELNINQMAQVGSWAWQTSYIFLRTKGVFVPKGKDPVSAASRFVVETGGNDLYREIEVTLPAAVSSKAGATSSVSFQTDVLKLFKGLPEVTGFAGTKPAGWAADPNLTKYDKFINGSVPTDMATVANNTKSDFITLKK